MTRRTSTKAGWRSRTLPVTTLAAGLMLGSTIGLSGCSGDDGSGASAAGASGVVGGVGGKTIGPGPSVTPTPAPKPERAVCSMLNRAAAARLLGSTPTGRADTRQWPPGTSELDGCVYLAAGGASLQYVVWSTQNGAATKVTTPPVPGSAPAQRFKPGIGQSSAGVTISTGGRATAQVSAYGKGRLVQVTTTATDSGAARNAATEAARRLMSTR